MPSVVGVCVVALNSVGFDFGGDVERSFPICERGAVLNSLVPNIVFYRVLCLVSSDVLSYS